MEHSMRVLGIVLMVLGLGAAVPATLTWIDNRSDAAETARTLQELEQRHDATLEQLQDTNLRYRGYQNSVPQIPDSIRAAESAIISGRLRDYSKAITALEIKDREQTRLINRTRTKRAEREDAAKASMIPFAAGTVVLLLAGVVFLRRA
jgi:hypothetical protein